MSAREDGLVHASTVGSMQPIYTVQLSLSVADPGALWDQAAEMALAAPGATLEAVVDTLGPREDPDLSACIAMLVVPASIAGCRLHDFQLAQPRPGLARSAANDQLAIRSELDASA